MLGNVAELANANVFMVKDGVVHTPARRTATFLNGINAAAHHRSLLLREAGVTVVEGMLKMQDFLDADEIFSCGNFQKVAPIVRIEDRPRCSKGRSTARRAQLYWDYAHSQ